MIDMRSLTRRERVAAILLLCGLSIEAFSVLWTRPVAFVIFVVFGISLIVAGILLFLYSVVSLALKPPPK